MQTTSSTAAGDQSLSLGKEMHYFANVKTTIQRHKVHKVPLQFLETAVQNQEESATHPLHKEAVLARLYKDAHF